MATRRGDPASTPCARNSVCRRESPLQPYTDPRDARRHDAERPQEGRAGRPARVLLWIGVEQVEDIDEPCNAAMSTEPEAFLDAHIEDRDVVHAARADRLAITRTLPYLLSSQTCSQGAPVLMAQKAGDITTSPGLRTCRESGRPDPNSYAHPCLER